MFVCHTGVVCFMFGTSAWLSCGGCSAIMRAISLFQNMWLLSCVFFFFVFFYERFNEPWRLSTYLLWFHCTVSSAMCHKNLDFVPTLNSETERISMKYFSDTQNYGLPSSFYKLLKNWVWNFSLILVRFIFWIGNENENKKLLQFISPNMVLVF